MCTPGIPSDARVFGLGARLFGPGTYLQPSDWLLLQGTLTELVFHDLKIAPTSTDISVIFQLSLLRRLELSVSSSELAETSSSRAAPSKT